jgi:glycosyltransferase involved in cell wall biosynthesis
MPYWRWVYIRRDPKVFPDYGNREQFLARHKERDFAMKSVKVICPVYNEELSIRYFYERYSKARDAIGKHYKVDLTFINNASTDATLQIIREIRESDPTVQVISHARNFGYQASIICGLTNVNADAYVIIDADCEDPPEMIPTFVEKWEAGYDLVYGQRRWRTENVILQLARRIFYRLTHRIADSDFIIDMAEFALFTRRVRDQVLSNRSTFPFVRFDLAFAGFRRIGIEYKREPRRFGMTNYNFFRMSQFALGGILSASTFPLRAIAYAGLPVMAIDAAAALIKLLGYNFSIAAPVLLNFSFFSFSFVVLSIYVARITKDVTGRPIFIVDVGASELNEPLASVQSVPSRIVTDQLP